tara:strand:- start:11223 stop:12056 length:834 start_codon:yes stop_codon:yes gene_type:complete
MREPDLIDIDTVWRALLNCRLGVSSQEVRFNSDGTYRISGEITRDAQELLDLYCPFATKDQHIVTAHLGQSMDGFIATTNGQSHYINGQKNIVHLHRMRALTDAVLVGSNTVRNDNPQLTTRLVDGPNPVRVVIDPNLRLSSKHHIFAQPDAPTLVLCGEDIGNKDRHSAPHVEILPLPMADGKMRPSDCCQILTSRGLKNLLIEGGGKTVSQFVNAGTVHYLQIALAPIFLGEGKRGLQIPEISGPNAASRLKTLKYHMGDDVLYHWRLTNHLTER